MEIIDLGWPWRPLHAIAAKWCEIGPRLLLIINKKSQIGFQTIWKSLTLDGLEGQWPPIRLAIIATAGLLVYFPASSSRWMGNMCLCVYECSANAEHGDTILVHGASGAVSILICWQYSLDVEIFLVIAVIFNSNSTKSLENVYGAVIVAVNCHCESSLSYLARAAWAPGGCRPLDQAATVLH